jgi:hypothetical protein
MKVILRIFSFVFILMATLVSCEEIRSYPETPEIAYKSFNLYRTTDVLGNNIILGKLEFDFTDGDGNLGIEQPEDSESDDSLKYNLFLSLYSRESGVFEKKEDIGSLSFRIPYIERQGQNKTLKGSITIDLEYKKIDYDTLFYTFYILDRDFNRSNTDTTDVLIFTGITL